MFKPPALTDERRDHFWCLISNLQEAAGNEDLYNTCCDELDAFIRALASIPPPEQASTRKESL